MKFDYHHYVPCLRWKQGEYQAILKLSDSTKNLITPLIVFRVIGFDFETQQPAKSLDEHLALFVKRIEPKWNSRWCFVDLKLIESSERMTDGRHAVEYIFDELRSKDCAATPVVDLDRDEEFLQAVREAVSKDQRGVCLRISIVDAAKPDLKSKVDRLLNDIGVSVKDSDLVIDLGSPSFEPIEGFTKTITMIVSKLPHLRHWRTFTVIATSFPEMGSISKGATIVQRYEWQLYKRVANALGRAGVRVPTFGDFAINRLEILQLDMRIVKPNATIRYTIDDAWLIVKGRNVRDYKLAQYKNHSQTVRDSQFYLGREFSWGDDYIEKCAAGTVGTGNLTTWREVGTNHHIEKVVTDISNCFDS